MATHQISIFGPIQDPPARKVAGSLRLVAAAKDDVFLNAPLEMPTTQQARRSPLKWLGAMALHILIVAALISVPPYTTGTIRLSEYHEISVVAPPPPLAPPPAPAGGPVAPHIARPKAELNYMLRRLTAPSAIPKNVSSESDNVGEAAPDFGGVSGGVPGGVFGEQIGGAVGGVLGGTGTTVLTPPPAPQPVQKIARVGSHIKAPLRRIP